MPELTDFLAMIAAEDWKNDTTKLIIEIKDHGNDELNTLAAQACVAQSMKQTLQTVWNIFLSVSQHAKLCTRPTPKQK